MFALKRRGGRERLFIGSRLEIGLAESHLCRLTMPLPYYLCLQEEVLQAFIEHDQKRARLLQAKLEAHQRRLKDHKTGSRRLTAAEHEQVSRQVKVFSDHVERLKSETHQHKLEKLEEHRESFDAMHAMDFIDFEKTGA